MISLTDKDFILLEKPNISKYTFSHFITLIEESHNVIIFSKGSDELSGLLPNTKKVNLPLDYSTEIISSNLFRIDVIFLECFIKDVNFLYKEFRKVTDLPIVFVISMDKDTFMKQELPLIKTPKFYNKIYIFTRVRSTSATSFSSFPVLDDYIISDFYGNWTTSIKNLRKIINREKIISQILDN